MVSGEKRNCEEENPLEGTTTILLDIEGTTTSISYIKDVLFPYVRDNLKNYVNEHWNDEEFKADLKALKSQAKKDEEEKIENFSPIEEGDNEKETLIKNILWQMDLDRKTTALKQFQGHIWREGYENGTLKGHMYGDVAPTLKKWCEEGRKLYIYSSGSVEAQKLLFKNSESGDLSGFITGYFDTEIGPKTEASSYSNIVNTVGCDAGQILFFTDVIKEAVAADKAGIQVMIMVREGNAPLSDDEKKAFSTISSLKDVAFESSNKKKKICEEETVRNQCEKTENVEKADESSEIKNGDAEKMETETTDAKVEDCNEGNKTEENGQTKMESEATDTAEAEAESIDVDVDDSKAETSAGEKVVSSSVEESEKPGETEKETGEEKATADGGKEEKADSTSESDGADKAEEKPAEEEDKTTVEETGKEEGEKEQQQQKQQEEEDEEEKKGMNGHENGDAKEDNGKEAAEETNGEANGKAEEVEAVPVKKVNPDEQADSTVEVKA